MMCLKHHILELEQDTINKHIKAYWYIVNLEYGYYSFVETKAPKGFELDDSRYEFRIDDDGEDGVPETIDGDTVWCYAPRTQWLWGFKKTSEAKSYTCDYAYCSRSDQW